MLSAFGVEHGEIYKAQPTPDQQRAQRYRKVSQSLAGVGAGSLTLGGVIHGIGTAEKHGKDPMGFNNPMSSWHTKPMTRAHQAARLRSVSRSHGTQAKIAGGLGAASLGLAAANRHRSKQLSKALTREKVQDTARNAGTAGVGAAAIGAGGYNAKFLGSAVHEHQAPARAAHHLVAAHKMGDITLAPKDLKQAMKTRRISSRVVGVKGAGALASAGIAGMGGKAIYDLARKKPGPGSAPKKR
jgi:hypothetical protein